MNITKHRLEHGAKYPYDFDDCSNAPPTPATDWAHAAARGVLADLLDRRGIKWELQKVDQDVRVELTQSLSEIIRLAAQNHKEQHLNMVAPADVPLPEPEHPAAKRLRERFEAKYGDLSDVVRAALAWRHSWADFHSSFNRVLEQPVTETTVESKGECLLQAIRHHREAYAQAKVAAEREQCLAAVSAYYDEIKKAAGPHPTSYEEGRLCALDIVEQRIEAVLKTNGIGGE